MKVTTELVKDTKTVIQLNTEEVENLCVILQSVSTTGLRRVLKSENLPADKEDAVTRLVDELYEELDEALAKS